MLISRNICDGRIQDHVENFKVKVLNPESFPSSKIRSYQYRILILLETAEFITLHCFSRVVEVVKQLPWVPLITSWFSIV